jgi:hypothetical protein
MINYLRIRLLTHPPIRHAESKALLKQEVHDLRHLGMLFSQVDFFERGSMMFHQQPFICVVGDAVISVGETCP